MTVLTFINSNKNIASYLLNWRTSRSLFPDDVIEKYYLCKFHGQIVFITSGLKIGDDGRTNASRGNCDPGHNQILRTTNLWQHTQKFAFLKAKVKTFMVIVVIKQDFLVFHGSGIEKICPGERNWYPLSYCSEGSPWPPR